MSDSDITVGELTARPGERVHGFVDVDWGEVRAAMPVVIVNGAEPGPRVGVEAGIHAGEYVCIEALAQVAMSLDPARLTGSLVASLISSPLAYSARTVYSNPVDGRNPNRAFPGDWSGTASERLAAWLSEQVIAPADRYIDMHGGDLNEALVPFTAVTPTGDGAVDEVSRAMAEAYGLQYTIDLPAENPDGLSSAQHAGRLGIPALLAEAGGQGLWPSEDVALHADGLRRALFAAGLLRDDPGAAPRSRRLETWDWLRTDSTGAWHAGVSAGDRVRAGQALGEVRDLFGATLDVITSPADGVVLFLVTGRAINAGDHVLAVGLEVPG